MNSTIYYAQKLVDWIADSLPATVPVSDALNQVRLVAHRGRGAGLHENQIEGLTEAAGHDVWGVEFDVRWSRDGHPVICHDETTARVFGPPDWRVANNTLAELRQRVPGLPSLDQALQALPKRTHLMIELKEPLTPAREEVLLALLANREPGHDYHILTLDPRLFETREKIDRRALILVSEVNAVAVSRYALENDWAGVAGHYLLQTPGILKAHHSRGQKVGVGFVCSFNNVCRQLARGADWIFTDRAVSLQQSIHQHLTELARGRKK